MAEYIDIDTPLELYVERGGFYRQQITTLRELLDVNHLRYEIADVRPVVRGRWEEHYETYDHNPEWGEVQYGYICSLCGRWEYEREPFCNCGAMMEES